MPEPPLPRELEEFLSKPNPAVIGTLDPGGAPHTAATWYVWRDGRLEVNMAESRKRLEHIRQEPRVSLTVLDVDSWYRHVTLRGRAVFEDDPNFEGIDRVARHYTGRPYPNHEEPRVHAVIEVETWYSWNQGRPWRPDLD